MKPSETRVLCVGMLLASVLIFNLYGEDSGPSTVDLRQASLEDLMDIKVTSVAKHEQTLSRVAAAIFVITAEDIRRSGATNIPDILRMAPGVDVEQIDANSWAISIRGFDLRFSNKVLVMIDGRSVYTPDFSGVYWDQLEMPLEDIDRIEVIRGPGGTVWGANAVNGVISIITKSTQNTKGGMMTAGAGSQLPALAELQYGGSAGQAGTYRIFGAFFDVGNAASQGGIPANDHWGRAHAGFRSDWQTSTTDSLMVQGDIFDNQDHQTTNFDFIPTPSQWTFPQTIDATGGDVLALWKHTLPGGSETSVQGYYDTYRRTDFIAPTKVTTFALDFQHHLTLGDRNDIIWGGGFRSDYSGLAPGYVTGYVPAFRTVNLFDIFLQDEFQISNALWLTLGAKLEHNAFSGFEIEPSARLIWSPPAGRYTVWAAASKSIRQPAQSDTDVDSVLATIPLNPNTTEVLHLYGDPNFRAEQIRDYEVGYRSELTTGLSFDVATYLSFYHDLQTLQPQAPIFIPGSPEIIDVPVVFGNGGHAVDFGGEVSLTWKPVTRWRVSPGYAYLHAKLRENDPADIITTLVSTEFPQDTFEIRSLFNLSRNMEFDQSLYYTARLPGGEVPGRARADLRLARRIGESAEISVVGQNLLRPRTVEYTNSAGIVGTDVVRSVYGKITWRF